MKGRKKKKFNRTILSIYFTCCSYYCLHAEEKLEARIPNMKMWLCLVLSHFDNKNEHQTFTKLTQFDTFISKHSFIYGVKML